MKYDIPYMTTEAVSLLKSLISIPSISREETQAADFLQNYIEMAGMQTVGIFKLYITVITIYISNIDSTRLLIP